MKVYACEHVRDNHIEIEWAIPLAGGSGGVFLTVGPFRN